MEWFKYDIRELSDDEYRKWYSFMDIRKQQRVDSFYYYEDKKRTVAGEMLVRKAVCEKCSVQPEDIEFFENEYGKPFVKGLPVYFNLSHSGNIVVCAVDDAPVGIDIEQLRPIDLKITKRFFTQTEIEYIFSCKPAETDFCHAEDKYILSRFFEIWTAKEAFAKYTGKGLEAIDTPLTDANCRKFSFDEYIMTIVCE